MRWITGVRKEELKQDVLTPTQKIEIIKRIVCDQYGQTWEHISKKGRHGVHSYAPLSTSRVFIKQVFIYFTREFTKDYAPRTTTTGIAKMLQGETKSHLYHTTILHATRMINNISERDKELREKLQSIRETIENELNQQRQSCA